MSRYIPQDRRTTSKFDATGRKQERLSEYFDFLAHPENADKKVTRNELSILLTRYHAIQQESRWHRRLWSWLVAHLKPAKPTRAEIEQTRLVEDAEDGR